MFIQGILQDILINRGLLERIKVIGNKIYNYIDVINLIIDCFLFIIFYFFEVEFLLW